MKRPTCTCDDAGLPTCIIHNCQCDDCIAERTQP